MPLSLAGTCAAMWLAGFSIDNLSLMALAVSVGFVVDDAIVMIENAFRNLEKGLSPLRAAIESARQIGFTVISISVSLIAAFIPLLFMGGLAGRLFREFSVTLVFAIAISTLVSLSVTPMICAHYLRETPSTRVTWLDRLVEGALAAMIAPLRDEPRLSCCATRCSRSSSLARHHRADRLSLRPHAEGLLPAATTAASSAPVPGIDQDISYQSMIELQKRAAAIVLADPGGRRRRLLGRRRNLQRHGQ